MPLSLNDLHPEPRFRPATIDDADLLYQWRLKDETQPFYPGATTPAEHRAWLTARIDNPLVKILIWEENGQPAGTVRIESNGELSFHHTGNPDEMLKAATAFAADYGGRLKATFDEGDPKGRGFDRAGFKWFDAMSMVFRP